MTYDPSFTFPEPTFVTICWSPSPVAQRHTEQASKKYTVKWSPHWNRSAANSSPDQTQYYTELSAGLSNYWQILAPTFKWDSQPAPTRGIRFPPG